MVSRLVLSVKPYGFASSPKGGAKGLTVTLLASPFGRAGCDQREQTERVSKGKKSIPLRET